MGRLLRRAGAALLGLVLLFAVTPLPVSAAGVFGDACNGQTQSATCNSAVQPGGSNPLTGSDGLLLKVAKVIAIIAGVTAIIVIIISGFSYMTADGDAAKAKKARDALVGALVGLFIIAIASVIVTFVINNSGV